MISTLIASANIRETIESSDSRRSSSRERYSHSTEQSFCPCASLSLQNSTEFRTGSVSSSSPFLSYPNCEVAFFQVKVQPFLCISSRSKFTISHAADADQRPLSQLSETSDPFSEIRCPTGPTTNPSSSGRKALSLDRNLRNAPLLLLAILCAARSMWSWVRFGLSKVRHSNSPQSLQFVGAGSVDASMSRVADSLYGSILGFVSEDSFAMNVLNSVARSRIPKVGSPDISEARGR